MVNSVVCFPSHAEGTLLLCQFGSPRHPIRDANNALHTLVLCLFFALAPANSFVSPSCTPFSCKSFVSPTYAKTWGWGMTNRPISEILSAGSSSCMLSAAGHWNSEAPLPWSWRSRPLPGRHKEDSGTVNCQLTTVNRLFPLTPTIPAPSATAALPIVPAPIFTTTSSTYVG